DLFRRNVKCFALSYLPFDQRLTLFDTQDDFALQDINRLVLPVVILQRQHLSRLDVQNLAHVLVGPGPDDLVAPRPLDPIRYTAHASLSFKDEGSVTHAVTQTPHPTHPSGFSTGRPLSSSASAFSPIGHARAQTPHSAPWNVMQRCGSSSRIPMCTCSHGTLVRAPVSHAAAHGMSSHAMHEIGRAHV